MYHFIVNPNSRSGSGIHIWYQIEPIIKESKCLYNLFFTKYQGHATAITSRITSDNQLHTIIILGGDGTVNEVVNGISNFANTTIGYIPSGSSNDFARGLGLTTDPKKAIIKILNPLTFQFIDIGTLIYENKIRKFAVSAGVGLDAAICHQVVVSKLKTILNKIGLGKLTYAGVALNQIIISSPKHMSLILDHDKKFEFKSAYMAAIMNVCYEGGGVKFCPRAVPNDGKLDILVLADIPKLKILTLLPTAFMGKHIHFKGVHTYTCRDISIHLESPQPAHTDGEPVSLQQHISACCADSQLRIIST